MKALKTLVIAAVLISFNSVFGGAFAAAVAPATCPQTKPVVINKALVTKLNTRAVDTSNAYEINQLLGEPCSCISLSPPTQSEAYTCQWKGDLSSNRVNNMLNVTFESGQLASITAITNDNIYYLASPGTAVKTFKS